MIEIVIVDSTGHPSVECICAVVESTEEASEICIGLNRKIRQGTNWDILDQPIYFYQRPKK